MTEFVTICEVGPRDGLQMAKTVMATPTKIAWIEALAASGLREIEVGSFVPAKLLPQMADTDAVVRATVTIPNLTIVALAPNLRGAQAAVAAGAHRISVPVSISEGHSRANLNRTPDEQVAEIGRIVAWLHSENHPAELEVACSTAFGCSFDGVIPHAQVLRIVTALAQAGVTSLGLADTVGYANPDAIKSLVRAVRAEIGPVLHGLHLHDTMGLGLANALAGLEAGIRDFDAALAGLGGCPFAPGASGNIVTEDLVFMIESMGLRTGIDLPALIEARKILHQGLPAEPMHGQVAKAGIPRTFRAAA
jgi:hydroxymethylglutaryl-CoA lyase